MTDVSLDTTVDAAGASDEQIAMYAQMADLFEDAFTTFVQKNLDYDSSFQSAGEIDQVLDSGHGPFDSAEAANLYKVFTRIQDKDQRFYSLVFCNTDDHVGESAADTAMDAAVYWLMIAWLLQYNDDA
jgi:hypothetical protein